MTDVCFVLPPFVADKVPGHDLSIDDSIRVARGARPFAPSATPGRVSVYTAGDALSLPGRAADVTEARAAEALAGVSATQTVLDPLSVDLVHSGLTAVVHYGRSYANAFWDGTQMVFGDGDGALFGPFSASIDVCAHELGHAVTGDRLVYKDAAGALNEHMSDAIGATVSQQALGLSVTDPAGWLIGSGIFMPGVNARGLRDMLSPGTAYDDPRLGKDPQPAHMSGYVVTTDDDGGVHINSGIPNRAFALASQAVGSSVDVLRIWLAALAALGNPRAGFAEFAGATVGAAGSKAGLVAAAWTAVGVDLPAPAPAPAPSPPPAPGPAPVPSPPSPPPIPNPGFPIEQVRPWLAKRYSWTRNERAAKAAINRWLNS